MCTRAENAVSMYTCTCHWHSSVFLELLREIRDQHRVPVVVPMVHVYTATAIPVFIIFATGGRTYGLYQPVPPCFYAVLLYLYLDTRVVLDIFTCTPHSHLLVTYYQHCRRSVLLVHLDLSIDIEIPTTSWTFCL